MYTSQTSSEAARSGYSLNDASQQKQDARTIVTKKENNHNEFIKLGQGGEQVYRSL